MRTLLLYASDFFNETTQESKYSKDFLELPLNFSLNHCFGKYKTVMTSYHARWKEGPKKKKNGEV